MVVLHGAIVLQGSPEILGEVEAGGTQDRDSAASEVFYHAVDLRPVVPGHAVFGKVAGAGPIEGVLTTGRSP